MTVTKNGFGRRTFLRSSMMASGGLMLGFHLRASFGSDQEQLQGNPEEWAEINAYLKIGEDGRVTIISANPEAGQGVMTSMPMIVAEELDVDWEKVVVEQAPLNTDLYFGQTIGGSNAIRTHWEALRTAGATARQMLREAAAREWMVPLEEISTAEGVLYHRNSGKSAGYGEMASAAALIPVPEDVTLKDIVDFKIIGTSRKNVRGREIVTGKPLYGSDIQVEDMLIAMIVHPPAFGLKLKSFDDSEARAMPGIRDIFTIKVLEDDYVRRHFDTLTFPVILVVVGFSTWEVWQAKKALKVEWEPFEEHTHERDDFYNGRHTVTVPAGLESTPDHRSRMEAMAARPGKVLRRDGDPEKAFEHAAKVIERTYTAPFLAHNCMEPMNFFANVTAERAELAGPIQKPEMTRSALSARLGMQEEQIEIKIRRLGGGFGRRSYAHWLIEAALISQRMKSPVKLLYTREDDMTSGIYRPAYRMTLRAALDSNNHLTAYHLNAGGIPLGPINSANSFPAGAIDNYLAETWEVNSNITVGSFRAPGHNFQSAAEESFLDEIAEAAGKDPIEFRLELLERARNNPVGENNRYDPSRLAGVLKLVREKSGWGIDDSDQHRGVAAYYCMGSYVAQVLDLAMENGKPVITRVCNANDCGVVVNPDGAANQTEGCTVDGIGNALYGNMTFTDGVPDKDNLDSYELIRTGDAPRKIDVHFVDNGIDPTGMGEPPFPPVMAALANALYRATGKRYYHQPFAYEAQPGGERSTV